MCVECNSINAYNCTINLHPDKRHFSGTCVLKNSQARNINKEIKEISYWQKKLREHPQ